MTNQNQEPTDKSKTQLSPEQTKRAKIEGQKYAEMGALRNLASRFRYYDNSKKENQTKPELGRSGEQLAVLIKIGRTVLVPIILIISFSIPIFYLTEYFRTVENIDYSFQKIAYDRAEQKVAASHGKTLRELKYEDELRCFEAVQKRTFDDDYFFTAEIKRLAAERACSKLAIAGPREIEPEIEKIKIQYWLSVLWEFAWRITVSLFFALVTFMIIKRIRSLYV